MSVQIYCTQCNTPYRLTLKECPKCGHPARTNKKYRVTVSFKGKRVIKHFNNLTLAREAETAIKADLMRGDLDIQTKAAPTLDQVWEKYLPWAKEHKKSWIDDLRYYNKHLQPRFGKKQLDIIAPIDVERMKLELKKGVNQRGKPYAPATIKHQISLLRRLFNLARRWGMYGGNNPIDQVEIPKLDNQITEFLTDDEATRLFEVLEWWPWKESAAFVKVAIYTGFRRGEIFKLTWNDIDFERGMITLRDPKGGKSSTKSISPEALKVLAELERSSEYVFPGKEGKQRVDFKGPWYRIRKAAGLPDNFRFHGLRHHYASSLASAGVDLFIVKEMLDHKDIKTTQRYAHLAPNALREAARKSGKILTPKPEIYPIKIRSGEEDDS